MNQYSKITGLFKMIRASHLINKKIKASNNKKTTLKKIQIKGQLRGKESKSASC